VRSVDSAAVRLLDSVDVHLAHLLFLRSVDSAAVRLLDSVDVLLAHLLLYVRWTLLPCVC
jgi:hypothetical protein